MAGREAAFVAWANDKRQVASIDSAVLERCEGESYFRRLVGSVGGGQGPEKEGIKVPYSARYCAGLVAWGIFGNLTR